MNELDYSDIGIVYTAYVTIDDVETLVEDSVNMRCCNTTSQIAVCSSVDCASAQWPAVIVLYEVRGYSEESDLTALNLMLSRARVYC